MGACTRELRQQSLSLFAAADRKRVVDPLVYHLYNPGIPIWYDRYELLIGDNLCEKNLLEGASL